ncbi:MAG: hypothetical protein P4L85_27170 [Paludisphaera borealis]|uniref:hypothetical protein n=1 Tax=Paludisphaera borealis TaxID=1387353 RepID=UPI00284A603E|nr:hypothetical protein [Paludisphaera borealis]MDR3623064.1 hypothetical protein [Paludisphaera borealis]
MITITRRQARRLRGVLRRHTLGIPHRGPVSPFVLHARGAELRAFHRCGAVAIEFVDSIAPGSHESIALPLDALAEFEGRDDSPVTLETLAPDRTCVRWTDRGVPQSRAYAVQSLDAIEPSPEPPTSWATIPAEILKTLAEASETASEDSARYALGCIRLGGETGAVAATDGRQLLIHGGFRFPWTDEVLIRRSPLFACPGLPRDQPVEVGRTGSHVVLKVGPWTLFLEIQTEGRFPDLGRVVPAPATAATRLKLDPDDARFLGAALDRLPGAAESHAPVVLELNGKAAVRARGADQAQATELVLARSTYSGAPVRLDTNRKFLSRALRLGFSEIEIVDAESPVVCRGRDLVFCWQPLSKDEAADPIADASHVYSIISIDPTAVEAAVATTMRTTVSEPRESTESHEPIRVPAAAETQEPAGLAALIREAESLHQTLTDARARAARVAAALRRHRRRERLVDATLASLRALKLQDVVG